MRIRIVKAPPIEEVDGIRLDQFRPVGEFRVGSGLAALFLAEGWGEPIDDERAADDDSVSGDGTAESHPPNLVREWHPPYFDSAFPVERRRARRWRLSTPHRNG
jgi:hypothetical protein